MKTPTTLSKTRSLPVISACVLALAVQSVVAEVSLDSVKKEVVATCAGIAEHAYADAHSQAVALQKAIAVFTTSPSATTLEAARQAWVAARLPYLQSEVFRFSAGPIDAAGGPWEMIDGWPLDEAYIDYVRDNPKAGLINDVEKYPNFDKNLIVSLNKTGGERNISSGYHAIEFLLWGQDLDADGPGSRPVDDYIKTAGASAPRRAQYLNACAGSLVDQLAGVAAEWAPGVADNYRARFAALPADQALQKVLTGVGTLSGRELAKNRIGVALSTQRDESSPFSDTTHLDMMYNCSGMANVIAGAYVGIDGEIKVQGPGLIKLASALGQEQGDQLTLAINDVMQAVTKFRPPFDKALLAPEDSPAREAIQKIVESLEELASTTAVLAKGLDVEIRTTGKVGE
jgi:putative iron-regulated protein